MNVMLCKLQRNIMDVFNFKKWSLSFRKWVVEIRWIDDFVLEKPMKLLPAFITFHHHRGNGGTASPQCISEYLINSTN